MAFTANEYVVHAAELYDDTAYVRISETTWIRNLNAAIRALILVRPDAGAVTESVQLVAGIKQTLPAVALRLLDISRNMGIDGLTAGKIVSPSDRTFIDTANLLWPVATAETAVDNFSYDDSTPGIFYVTPPISSTTAVYVEMSTSQLPTAITDTGDLTGINDIFFEPIVQFMLFKAYSVDDESVEFDKANTFFNNFLQLLGLEKRESDDAGPTEKGTR